MWLLSRVWRLNKTYELTAITMETIQREERSGRRDLLSPRASLSSSLSCLQSADWYSDLDEIPPSLLSSSWQRALHNGAAFSTRMPPRRPAADKRPKPISPRTHFNLAGSFRSRAPTWDQSSSFCRGWISTISRLGADRTLLVKDSVKRSNVIVYTTLLELENEFSFLNIIMLLCVPLTTYNQHLTSMAFWGRRYNISNLLFKIQLFQQITCMIFFHDRNTTIREH